MKTAFKSTLAVAATTAAVAGLAAVPSMVSAIDNTFSRPLYSYQEANEGVIKNITFNSIKTVESDKAWASARNKVLPLVSNESNFVGAREDTGKNEGVNNVWEGSNITAEDGKTYIVRLYVHNNAAGGEANTALDTQVRFYVPYGSATTQTVNGWLRSSNSTPKEYSDTVNFNSKNNIPFHLEYVNDSALLENGGFAKGAGVKLTNTITNQGNPSNLEKDEWTTIGYNGLDGKIPGCYEYINYVTIRVKVVYDYSYTVDKKVRVVGAADQTWKESVEAKVGDKVEFQFTYTNTSDFKQTGVVVRDLLPNNLRYVKGSTKIWNGEFSGATINNDDVVIGGLNIGSYDGKLPANNNKGANAHIRITAEVVDDNLACGSNTLINWAQVRVGDAVVKDDARVHLNKVCANNTPTKLPETGPTAIASGVIATGSIATAAGYYIVSRRQLR